jgi:adhesin transport system outer membrane protein
MLCTVTSCVSVFWVIAVASMLSFCSLTVLRPSSTFFFLSSSNRFFIGLSATPGAGLSVISGVDAAQARLQAAQGEIDSARRNLIEQVSLEHISALTQQQRLRSLSSGLRWIRAMVDSWDRQFLAGRKTWVEVMNAARELAQAHTALAEVEVALVVASWRLAVLSEGVPAILSATQPLPSVPRP